MQKIRRNSTPTQSTTGYCNTTHLQWSLQIIFMTSVY